MTRPPAVLLGANVHGVAALWVWRTIGSAVDDAVKNYARAGHKDVADAIWTAAEQIRTASALYQRSRDDAPVSAVGNAEVPEPSEQAPSSRGTGVVDTLTAGAILGLTDRRVRQLIFDGSLVAQKTGGRWLVENPSLTTYQTIQELSR